MKQFLKTLKGAVVLTVLMAVLSSVIYPAVTTVLAQTVFKEKADGSLIYADGKAVGSEVVGQQWSNPAFLKEDLLRSIIMCIQMRKRQTEPIQAWHREPITMVHPMRH